MKKFTVQLTVSVAISKEIKAETMQEALDMASNMANKDGSNYVRPVRGWATEYGNDSEVIALFK